MYKCDLNICLVGLESEAAAAINSVEPLEWFTHKIFISDCFGEIDVQGADVLIFKASAGTGEERVRELAGENTHRILEAVFKSMGRTLKMAVAPDAKHLDEIPSTKGTP